MFRPVGYGNGYGDGVAKQSTENKMTEQSKAQRLADAFDDGSPSAHTNRWKEDAAAELRRLDALVGELVEALDRLVTRDEADGVAYTGDHPIAQAKATLAKAKEQT